MKNISIILILSLLYSTFGCYTGNSPITKDDDLKDYLNEGTKLNIMTKDSVLYFFNAKTYKIVNDTLSGKGQRVIKNKKMDPEPIKIAVDDISQIQDDQYDYGHQNIISIIINLLLRGICAPSTWEGMKENK